PVLGAAVIALAVPAGGVVDREEDFQNLAEGGNLGVKCDLHHLYVSSIAAADCLVRRIGQVSAHVARFYRLDTLHPVVNGFQAPETAATQGHNFSLSHVVLLYWMRQLGDPSRVARPFTEIYDPNRNSRKGLAFINNRGN